MGQRIQRHKRTQDPSPDTIYKCSVCGPIDSESKVGPTSQEPYWDPRTKQTTYETVGGEYYSIEYHAEWGCVGETSFTLSRETLDAMGEDPYAVAIKESLFPDDD